MAYDYVTQDEGYSFKNISTSATTTVKSGAGYLHSIVVNKAANGAVTIYDNTAGSGTLIATLKASIVEGTYIFDCKFSNGLYVIPAAATDITLMYR